MIKERPTEVGTGVIASIAWLICYFLNINDPTAYLALIAVIAFVPAAITWVVVKLHKRGE